MKATARLYNCHRCYQQVLICSSCDRGQIYCGQKCGQLSRKQSIRDAGIRYQKTSQGKLNHAKRQREYRARQRENKKIVTHQGSHEERNHDVLPEATAEGKSSSPANLGQELRCYLCQCPVSEFLRKDFLDNQYSLRAISQRIAQGP